MSSYYVGETVRRLFQRSKFTISFGPAVPRARDLIGRVSARAGGRMVSDPHKADAVFFYPHKTSVAALHRPNPLVPGFNFFCGDTSPARIAAAFQTAFGYDIGVDPAKYSGKIAIKPMRGEAADLQFSPGPFTPKEDHSYQRRVDTELQPGFAVKFECITVKGEAVLVYMKVRPKSPSTAGAKTQLARVSAADVFTADELSNISQFCAEIGLDWGQITVLRDKSDGHIYIVDVKKTDIALPEALTAKDKRSAIDKLAEAFADAVLETPGLVGGYGGSADSFDETADKTSDKNIESDTPEIVMRIG